MEPPEATTSRAIPSEFYCANAACRDILYRPVGLRCGHRVCGVHEILQGDPCPACGEAVDLAASRDDLDLAGHIAAFFPSADRGVTTRMSTSQPSSSRGAPDVDLTMDDGGETEDELELPTEAPLDHAMSPTAVARDHDSVPADAAASAGPGMPDKEPLPDPPPDIPVPALPQDALAVMFGFPRWHFDRYEPTQLPLIAIVCIPCVRIVETPHGRHAVAAADIPAHTTLGWYEGLVVKRPYGLLDLHPYAMSKDGESRSQPAIIGSPLAWPSYVDHASGADRNIAIHTGERPSSPAAPARNHQWPFMYSTRSIRAGEKLHFNYDGTRTTSSFLSQHAAQRRAVYGRLSSLIAQQPPLSLRRVFLELSKAFPELGRDHTSRQQELWEPLFRILRPQLPDAYIFSDTEAASPPRPPRVRHTPTTAGTGKSRRRDAREVHEEDKCSDFAAADRGDDGEAVDEPPLPTPLIKRLRFAQRVAEAASGSSRCDGPSDEGLVISAVRSDPQTVDIAINSGTQTSCAPQLVASQSASYEDGVAAPNSAATAPVACAQHRVSAMANFLLRDALGAWHGEGGSRAERTLCVSPSAVDTAMSGLESARLTHGLSAIAIAKAEDTAKRLSVYAANQKAAYDDAVTLTKKRCEARDAVSRARENMQGIRGVIMAAQAEVQEADCEGSRMLSVTCEGLRLEMQLVQAREAASTSALRAAVGMDPGAVDAATASAAAAQAASEALAHWTRQREAREAGAAALAARRVELSARLNRLGTESSAAELALQAARDAEARLPPSVDVERARQASSEADAAVERYAVEELRRVREHTRSAKEELSAAEVAVRGIIQEMQDEGDVLRAAEQEAITAVATVAEEQRKHLGNLMRRISDALCQRGEL